MTSDKPEEFDKFLSQELRDTEAKCKECKEKSTEEVDEKKPLKRARESSAESDTEWEAKDTEEKAKERKRGLMPRTEMHLKVLRRIAGKKRATGLPSDPVPASEDSSEEDEDISGSKSDSGEESEEEIWNPRRAARFN